MSTLGDGEAQAGSNAIACRQLLRRAAREACNLWYEPLLRVSSPNQCSSLELRTHGTDDASCPLLSRHPVTVQRAIMSSVVDDWLVGLESNHVPIKADDVGLPNSWSPKPVREAGRPSARNQPFKQRVCPSQQPFVAADIDDFTAFACIRLVVASALVFISRNNVRQVLSVTRLKDHRSAAYSRRQLLLVQRRKRHRPLA